MMHCITYGTLPERDAFDRAFERECPNGVYHITNDPTVGTVDLTQEQAWTLIETGVKAFERTGDTCETDLAGAILYTLGIEWV